MNVDQKPWLLISVVFKGHEKVEKVEKVTNLVLELNGKIVAVPSHWTNFFQPLQLTRVKKHNLGTLKKLSSKCKKPKSHTRLK